MAKKLSCVSCGSLKRFPHTFTIIMGCIIGANNKEAVGMLEQSRENITLVLSRSRNSTFAKKVSNSLMLKSLPARDRPLSSIFENEIDTKSLLSGG